MIRGVCIPLIVSTLVLDSVCIYLLDVKAHLCRSSDAITGNNFDSPKMFIIGNNCMYKGIFCYGGNNESCKHQIIWKVLLYQL